ncbi:hypothetical protein AMK09_13030 [Streptomyces sp. CB02488]|uniref:hypothetical protein n=1 Tax=Streptomyces sp. CB02488 TaxID=1703920 RepID=UPI00093C2592|nr:hypothetical protein [Streptomyces sp. CB02488]OKK21397.1 hypothetical protein AMK09_13030 [Streptomyces sp. CB02488]
MDRSAQDEVDESVDESVDEPDCGPPFAECVLCRKPTEYAESVKGITLCPVCEWQEAQRTACSG